MKYILRIRVNGMELVSQSPIYKYVRISRPCYYTTSGQKESRDSFYPQEEHKDPSDLHLSIYSNLFGAKFVCAFQVIHMSLHFYFQLLQEELGVFDS